MNDQRKKIYADLKDKELKRQGFFIGESQFVVERMISSDWELESVVCTPAQADYFKALINNRCPVEVLSKEEISSIVGYPFHRGVLAAGIRPRWPDVTSFLSGLSKNPLVLICPAVSDPSNVGAIIRCARAFGVQGIVFGKNCGDPLTRIGIRASMGNVFFTAMTFMDDEEDAVRILKEKGFMITGTVLDKKALKLNSLKSIRPEALVMGHEAEGLSEFWAAGCDRLVTIPMADSTDSLNVAAAASVFLYHLCLRENQDSSL